MSPLRRLLPLATLAIAVMALYLDNLDGVGLLEKDEPRYAAIGRAMAQTHNFVTPKLWGSPWFEKPPLLYWMTAAGTFAGLNPELSARLPVALLSLVFLAVAFVLLRREFGTEAAAVSVALLASSAGWITFSALCLTDLPLSVCFSLAVFLALPLVSPMSQPTSGPLSGSLSPPPNTRIRLVAIGALLGFAALAKGLVPVALSLPFFWYLRACWRNWWIALLAFFTIALPWYVMVYAQNGNVFLVDFFLKHHLERLYSPSLLHVQPWYYYLPVTLAGLFPWTPLLGLLALRKVKWDARRRFLLAVSGFAVIFFSASLNKLPGYVLPIFPALFAVIGSAFETRKVASLARWWLLPSAALVALLPLLAHVVPQWLAAGKLSAVPLAGINSTELFYVALPIVAVGLGRRSWALMLLVLCVVAGGLYLKAHMFPVLDRDVSARGLWRSSAPFPRSVCDDYANRDVVYGLSFYRGSLIPPCGSGAFAYHLQSRPHAPAILIPAK